MATEKRRLFVGGLNAGTTEQDVRERFKSFGSIESVELHKVQKKEGFSEKTFAYVNIESSEVTIKKCVSLLSNTKWRGGVLKIELAKESFLSRLKKEREQLASEKARVENNHSSIPSLPKELQNPVRSAVPGTLIEGQKNWIVGKFGRALPVVHMRSKHGKKILKFDPSKTVHNLKRFKEGEEQDAALSQLTWSLGPQRTYPWDNNTSKEIGVIENSSSSDDVDGDLSDDKKSKSELVKKSDKSRNLNKRVVGLADNESDSDSDKRTAKKKSKMIISKQKGKQDINGNASSCSDNESDNDNYKIQKKIKKKKKVLKPEKSSKQEQSNDSSLISQKSSDDESELQKTSKKQKKNTQKHTEKDTSDASYCGNESTYPNVDSDNFNTEEINLKPKKKKKRQTNEEGDSNLLNIGELDVNGKTENISSVESAVIKPTKKRKNTNDEEIGYSNALDASNDDDLISKGDVVNDSKPKQKKKKESKIDVCKESCESLETDVNQLVLSDESFTKATKKEKKKASKNKNMQEIIGKSVEEHFFDNQNQVDNNNFEKKEGHPFVNQDEDDDKNDHKELTKKKKKAKLIEKEAEKLAKEQKEINVQMKAKDDEDVVRSDSNDNNNNKHNNAKQTSTSEDVTKTPTTGLTQESKNQALTKSNRKDNNKASSANVREKKTKKLMSNEKRLKAIKDKEINANTMQSIVSSALQNIDKTDSTSCARHITFDDDDDDDGDDTRNGENDDDNAGNVNIKGSKQAKGERNGEDKKRQASEKISGSKATNWLGLDSDSDEDSLTFDAKPQFEGKTGQKLFELQKTYRGDNRFQLDKRFADSDNEDDKETVTETEQNDTDDDDGDDTDDANDKMTKQISQEKDMAMSVLRGILGENIGTKYDTSRKQKFKDSNSLRYDPTRDDHAQFEQVPKKDSSPEPAVKETQPTSEDAIHGSSIPEVDSDKYYDVNTDLLTEMFSNKNKEDKSTSFTFLSNQNDNDDDNPTEVDWGQAEILKSKPVIPVMLPYDSSGDEQDNDDVDDDTSDGQQQTNKHSLKDERFFFHFGDPDLESKVYDQENVFMRTETLEQLNQHWVNVRSELTHDYKKKHKDALRRQSKMAAKRARMR